jgi:C4-dicarboxylate transporter, DctQ subunit
MSEETGLPVENDDDGDDARPRWRVLFVALPRVLTAVLIITGVAINFANVISRYLFDFALYWAEEVMVFIVIWCVFLGAISVTFKGAHLRMDLVSARIPRPWKEIVNGAAALVFLAVSGFVAVQSWKVVSLIGGIGQVSNAAGVPMVIPHLALLVGFVFMVAAVALRLRAYIGNRF